MRIFLQKKFLLLVLLFLSATLCVAQTQNTGQGSPQNAEPEKSTNAKDRDKEKDQDKEREIEKQEQSQRILGVVPQFGVTSRHDAPPLTAGEKFHLFVKSAFDPVEFGLVGVQTGISQAEDEFPEYGQGAAGYSKRYGAAFADEVSSGFWSNYFYPVLLKEDPRYFRLGEGTTMHRLGYALAQEFTCHTDKGGRSFNWSNTLGSLSAGGLSNAYYPESDRGLELTLSRAAIAMFYGSLGGLSDEFWPDIDRKFIHRHAQSSIPGK